MEPKLIKLFYGDQYYPLGGYEDFKGNFSTIEEAKSYVEKLEQCFLNWAHIVIDDKIVLKGVLDTDFINEDIWEWEEN